MSHALAAPSKLAQIVQCPGSLGLCAKYPRTDNQAAAAGRRSHGIGAALLVGEEMPDDKKIGDEYSYAAQYAKWVLSLAGGNPVVVEKRVNIPRIHPDSCWGTPDAYFWVGDTLHVVDYKYGWGIVEPDNNWQLLAYAAGVIPPGKDQYCHVKVHIFQPRPWHPLGPARTWDIGPATNLRGRINQAHSAVAAALSDSARTSVGPQCKYCRARHDCPALWAAVSSVVEMASDTVPTGIQPAGLGAELSMLRAAGELINHRLTGIEAQITALITGGGLVPGWAVGTSTPGRKAWSSPANEIKALGSLMGVDLTKPDALITPTQAVKAGMPKDVVNKFITQNAPSLKLIPAKDTLAAKAFKKEI